MAENVSRTPNNMVYIDDDCVNSINNQYFGSDNRITYAIKKNSQEMLYHAFVSGKSNYNKGMK
jgi:hypothetical protein